MNDNTEPAEIAASAVGRTLLKTLSDELERQPAAWRDLSEVDQHQALERMRQSVRLAVTDALRVIFGQQMPAVPATLEGLSSKGSISMRLTVAKSAANRHELLDAVGTQVVVLIGNPDVYLEGMDEIRATAQQPDLFTAPDIPPLDSDLGPEPDPEPQDPPPPGPDDIEDNWVETALDRDVERNRITQNTRVSRRALAIQLLEKLTTWNADASNLTIRFSQDTVLSGGRAELLLALHWFDAYSRDIRTEIQPPPFLVPERPAP